MYFSYCLHFTSRPVISLSPDLLSNLQQVDNVEQSGGITSKCHGWAVIFKSFFNCHFPHQHIWPPSSVRITSPGPCLHLFCAIPNTILIIPGCLGVLHFQPWPSHSLYLLLIFPMFLPFTSAHHFFCFLHVSLFFPLPPSLLSSTALLLADGKSSSLHSHRCHPLHCVCYGLGVGRGPLFIKRLRAVLIWSQLFIILNDNS